VAAEKELHAAEAAEHPDLAAREELLRTGVQPSTGGFL